MKNVPFYSDTLDGHYMKISKLGLLGILFVFLGTGFRACADADVYLSALEVPERVINKIPNLNQEVPINVTVINEGDFRGVYIFNLTVNGNVTSTRKVNVRPGESKLVELSISLYGEPRKAMWPGNKDMPGATYLIEVDGLSATTSVTPFPDFTIYAIILDIACIVVTALFIRWVSSPT